MAGSNPLPHPLQIKIMTKKHLVYRSNVTQCAGCGTKCTWLKTKAGAAYLTEVEFDKNRNDWFYKSSGNHSNLRVAHNCVSELEKFLADARFNLERLGEALEFDGFREDGTVDGRARADAWKAKKSSFPSLYNNLSEEDKDHWRDEFLDRLDDAQKRNNLRKEYLKQIDSYVARIAERREKIQAARCTHSH